MTDCGGPVSSPCVQVCTLGAEGLCEGCLRTVEEIAGWAGFDDDERRAVLARLAERRTRRSRAQSG